MDSKSLEIFLNELRDTIARFPLEEAAVKHCDDKTQDLLHKLELEDLYGFEYTLIAQEIQEVRRERRCAKDEIEKATPIIAYLESNKRVVDQLTQLLGEIRKIERRHKTRTYSLKVQD